MARYNLNITVLKAPLSNVSNSTKVHICFLDASFYHAFAYVIIFVVSMFGNSMTVAVIIKGKLVSKNAHLFLLNMAIADLVVTVVYMPRMVVMMLYGNSWLVTGTFGLVLCRTVPFLHHLAILVPVFTILGATFDRFCAMVFPLRNIMTRTVTRIIVVATWLVSAILRSPYLVTPILKPAIGAYQCVSSLGTLFGILLHVYAKLLLSVYCSSLFITIVLYSITIFKLRRSKSIGASNDAVQVRKEKASIKLFKLFIAVTICFICCWFVYFFADIFWNRPFPCELKFFRFFLAHSNSAINPCLLAVFNDRYRNAYKQIWMKIISLCTKCNSQQSPSSSPSVDETVVTPF
ncbi:hypothetical protein QZH41_003232 [Actinostola sp. cb2023]|nr:hypothetical protein QZH41_003232 [Actinostola sp. cb2023]